MKAIIFDIGEVLLKGLYGTEKHISRTIGKSVTNQDLHIPELQDFFRGLITEAELWQKMIEEHDWPLTVKQLKKLVRKNFAPVPGTREVIKELRSQHCFRLGLLSVHGREWVRYLDSRFAYHSLFDHVSYSYTSSVCKPDPRAYIALLQGLQCKPEECLFIDDIPMNIMAARDLGFRTHRFSSARNLRIHLISRGLLHDSGLSLERN